MSQTKSATASRDEQQTLLRVTAISKTFPGLRALDGVDLEIASQEIVALLGQNGSGKSTLVKILAGVYEADPGGKIEVFGPNGQSITGAEARRELHFIHQDLGLIPMLSTIENLDLGHAHGARGLLPTNAHQEARRAEQLIAEFGASFDVRVPVSELLPAERTIVAIARALDKWDRPDNVLILDEPTTALHGDEVDRLFDAVRAVAKRGAGIVFISHRLDEVMNLADRVVVLRDGRMVANARSGEYDDAALVRMIVGREVAQARIVRDGVLRDVTLSVRNMSSATVSGFNLDLRGGEIVGVTGILGSGREHVAPLLFGALPLTAGEIKVAGRVMRSGDPHSAVKNGMALVPANRHADGAVMEMTARENLTLPRLKPLQRFLGRLDGAAEKREVDTWVEDVGLQPPNPERPIELFSGGNQQKVVLAKWLRNKPEVLLLDEPTQGVDVGAKASIYQMIARAAEAGGAVLVCSSDTRELTWLCDRVIVMRDGAPAAELSGDDLTEHRLVAESLGLPADQTGPDSLGENTEDSRVQ